MDKKDRERAAYDDRVVCGAILLERVRPGCLIQVNPLLLSFEYNTVGLDIVCLALGMNPSEAIEFLVDFCPELRRNSNHWQFGFCPCCNDPKEPEDLRQAWIRLINSWRFVTNAGRDRLPIAV